MFSGDFSGLTPQSSLTHHPRDAGGGPGAALDATALVAAAAAVVARKYLSADESAALPGPGRTD